MGERGVVSAINWNGGNTGIAKALRNTEFLKVFLQKKADFNHSRKMDVGDVRGSQLVRKLALFSRVSQPSNTLSKERKFSYRKHFGDSLQTEILELFPGWFTRQPGAHHHKRQPSGVRHTPR